MAVVDADSPEAAFKSAVNIAPHSGVIALPPGVNGSTVTDPGITSSSGTSRSDETKLGSDIKDKMDPGYIGPTNNTSYLDDFQKQLDSTFNAGNSSINGSYDTQRTQLEGQQKNEVGQESSLLARVGGYLGDSGSGAGVMLNLAQSHRNEIASLESKRQSALQDARKAYTDQSYDLAKAKMGEADKYEAAATDAKQKFFDQVSKSTQESSIMSLIKQGITDPAKLYDYLNFKQDGSPSSPDGVPGVSIDTINAVLGKYNPGGTGAFKLDNEDIGKLLGAGFSRQDIASVLDYVNTKGYTDELRQSLTATERAVLDTVFNGKSPATGIGNTITISEAKQLGLPVALIGRGEQQILADLSNSTAPDWYIQYLQGQKRQNLTDETILSEWDSFRNGILGNKVSSSSSSSASGSSGFDYSSY